MKLLSGCLPHCGQREKGLGVSTEARAYMGGQAQDPSSPSGALAEWADDLGTFSHHLLLWLGLGRGTPILGVSSREGHRGIEPP